MEQQFQSGVTTAYGWGGGRFEQYYKNPPQAIPSSPTNRNIEAAATMASLSNGRHIPNPSSEGSEGIKRYSATESSNSFGLANLGRTTANKPQEPERIQPIKGKNHEEA